MKKIVITGGKRLKGRVRISGSKTATLPIMAATLLTNGVTTLENIPHLKDVSTMAQVLSTLGAEVEFKGKRLKIDTTNVNRFLAPYNLVKTMRASFLVFGSLLAKLGKAQVSLPGGCAIGSRPVDLHLRGFEELGAEVSMDGGYAQVKKDGLIGTEIYLDFPSVGATENLLMAATLAKGKTLIENAAREPEVMDLADFLNKMGAKIKGAGRDTIEISGVKELKGTGYRIIPDRIEAGTYMIASAITRGDVILEGVRLDHLEFLITKLHEAGVETEDGEGRRPSFQPGGHSSPEGGASAPEGAVRIKASSRIKAVDVKTMPYPGFPTDMQAQFMVLMSIIPGTSIITETIFENRFMHVPELLRMGADIKIEGSSALVKGVKSLNGAPVMATDLRASAALLLAGLVAKGKTEVTRIYHLDRGYEKIVEKLSGLGAQIARVGK